MAGPSLPVNIDTTYADSGTDASQKIHQQHHDTAHAYVNLLDTTALSTHNDGDVLEWDATSGSAKWVAPTAPGSSSIFSMVVPLSSFTGADDSAKFRNAISTFPGSGNRPIIFVPSGTTLDSGANNPFVLPSGFHVMSSPGGQDEFGYQGSINVRHTGSTTTLGTFKMAAGPSKGQKFTGVCFEGTSSTRCFVDTAQDASDGAYWQYVHFSDCSWDQFESIWQGTGTGVGVTGRTYINNMACGRPAWNVAGSDHQFVWTGFAEMGAVATYATRNALTAMFYFPNTNMQFGPLYPTGSPTTPFRVDNGVVGIGFENTIAEGRPSPGTTGTPPTDGLHCSGALYRLTGGRCTIRGKHYGYAMRDPRNVAGYQPGGFFHVSGGSHSIIGGTFQPYPAANYPAWTRPDGTGVSSGLQPPLAWVTGSTTRLNVSNIVWGSNVTSTPVVFVPAASTANVVTDGSVTVTTY
jgi:hypothetical protein